MDQRTSVILAAVLFAVVVAASVAYLIYGTPVTAPNATPTPTQEAQATATPAMFVIASVTPFPTVLPLAAPAPTKTVAPASVKATAKTGPEEWALVAVMAAPLLGAAGLIKLARS